MNIYTALGLCFLPSIICFVCFAFFARIKISSLLFAGLFGLLAVLPITFLQFYFSEFFQMVETASNHIKMLQLFFKALIFNGLVEELLKMIFIVLIPVKKLKLKKYFLTVLLFGLFLGTFESAVYLLREIQTATQRNAQLIYNIVYVRIFTADLIHTCCAGLCGLFVWGVRKKRIDVLSVIFAVFIHGAFDFFVQLGFSSYWLAAVSVLFAIMECRVRYVKQTNQDESVAAENETIIVFQQNDEPGEKRRKMDSSIVGISPTKPKDYDERKTSKKEKKDSDADKTQEASLVRKMKKN
jgi:RsiW-degrading membrane proteinase PrsW (M82 family)